jgi:TfoX-like protein
MSIKDLKGLGPKSEQCLNEIGIFSKEDLEQIDAVNAYIKLENSSVMKPRLNLLYAMVGALEDRHWSDVAKNDKGRLLLELEDLKDLKDLKELNN